MWGHFFICTMKKTKKHILILVVLLIVPVVLAACGDDKNVQKTKYQNVIFDAFDTPITITAYCDSDEEFSKLFKEISDEFIRYHQLFDIYNSYDFNNAQTINNAAGKEAVVVDDAIIELIELAKDIEKDTDGKMNIAMGSVLYLWHQAREHSLDNPNSAYIPAEEDLQKAAAHVNIDDVITDLEKHTVYLSDPEMRLDLGAVAKGFAVEKIAEKLIAEGHDENILINAGGNIRTIGQKLGTNWVVGVQNPDINSSNPAVCKLSVGSMSVVTSGVYERFFTVDGVDYHHIIDGETLRPENRYLSVSIITEKSGLADALSTALFNMSLEEGQKYIKEHSGIEAAWIMPDGEIIYSDGAKGYLCD